MTILVENDKLTTLLLVTIWCTCQFRRSLKAYQTMFVRRLLLIKKYQWDAKCNQWDVALVYTLFILYSYNFSFLEKDES